MGRPLVVCFDVGYTLIDETRSWFAWASWLEVTPEQLFAALRESIALREPQPNRSALEKLRPGFDFEKARSDIAEAAGASIFTVGDIYPEVRPTMRTLQAAGFRLGAAGNMRAATEALLAKSGLPLDFVGSSERAGASPSQIPSSLIGLLRRPARLQTKSRTSAIEWITTSNQPSRPA